MRRLSRNTHTKQMICSTRCLYVYLFEYLFVYTQNTYLPFECCTRTYVWLPPYIHTQYMCDVYTHAKNVWLPLRCFSRNTHTTKMTTYMYICIFVYLYICKYVFESMHIHKCMYIFTYTYTYVYIHIYIYTYTYTHIYIFVISENTQAKQMSVRVHIKINM